MSHEEMIVLEDKDGKRWTSTKSYQNLMGRIDFLEITANKLWEELYADRDRIFALEEPQRLQKILERFTSETQPHKAMWFELRHVRQDDLLALVKHGKAEEVKHPSGRFVMYKIKEKKP